jgi:hypothetical protein
MFFQQFIFPAKTLWEKYSEHIWVFHCRSPRLGNPRVFYTFYIVYIWHCRIKLFLRHLPNCPCSNFSLYVDLFQEISPRIRWSLCHFYEIIRLLLCFFSGLYFPPKHYGEKYSERIWVFHCR